MYNFGISEHVEWSLLAEGKCNIFLIRGIVSTRARGLVEWCRTGVLADFN